MALSSSPKGILIPIPVLVLSAAGAAIFLFFLLSSLSSLPPASCSCPTAAAASTAVVQNSRYPQRILTTEEDVEWVKTQIELNGLHMQDNVLRKGINPRTRAQQLQDLIQRLHDTKNTQDKKSKIMAAIASLKPLKIQTTTNGETFEGFKKGDDQPLSPMSRLFHEPGSNVYIVGIIGLKTKIKPDIFKHNLVHILLRNHRFSSVQVTDKENGSMKWIPTHVNIDDHVIIVKLDPNMESSDKFVEDFISNLSRSPIESTKPLWDLHILDLKTSEAEGTCVFRFHHSLGDGVSLMNLLLACTHTDPDKALPTLPRNMKKSGATIVSSLWSRLGVLWNSLVALVMFMLTALFLEDTKTPMKGSKGVEGRPRRFVIKSVSLDDIKLVKNAMNVTINDVVLGVTQAGFYRYLHRRYCERDTKYTNIPDNIRLRSTLFFNLRATTKIEDIMDTNRHGTWGNKIGYALHPFKIGPKKDPLDYVREAKAVMDRKKASLEPLFTYFFLNLILKLFGIKVAGKLNHKVFYNTTLWFSNVPGPREEISLFGHEVAYIAPSCYGQPNALMIHVVSYVDKLTFVISADEETIPNPHQLCHDLEESLRIIKASVLSTSKE